MKSDLTFLVQSDTTVGFVSSSKKVLCDLKKRSANKPFLQVCTSLRDLQALVRVPSRYKNLVRRSQKTTFIYPKQHSHSLAIRVVKEAKHKRFLDKLSAKVVFSTSANLTGKEFDAEHALKNADIVVHQGEPFASNTPSKIFKISHNIQRIR